MTTIQPILAQKWLENTRVRLLRKLEDTRRSRVIALVHRQETMSLLGFPIFRYINIEDSEEILRAIKLTDKSVPIDLIVHTPGGACTGSPADSPRAQESPRESYRVRAPLRDVGRDLAGTFGGRNRYGPQRGARSG